jgi:hypothetical protein
LKKSILIAGMVALTLFTGIASAETWAFTDSVVPGNQSPADQNGGGPILLANNFSVTAGNEISVDNIGVFISELNGDGSGTPLGTLTAAIVDSGGNVIAGTETVFTAGTTYTSVNANDVYQAVSQPVILGTGSYWFEVLGYNNPDANGNSYFPPNQSPGTDQSGVLAFGTSAYTYGLPGGNAFGVPVTADGLSDASQPQYEIGTFSYELAPEPGTFGMFGLGSVLGFAILRRNRKSGRENNDSN